MAIFKRGRTWWFEFWKDGQRFQRSTKQRNFQAAKDIESAFRTALAKGDVGITERPKAPTLSEFKNQFMNWVCSEKDNERTQQFYETCYKKLCEFRPFGNTRIDKIDGTKIENFKLWALKDVERTTVNRYLATLRKALRYAWRKLNLIDRMPIIELYPHERGRDFVYTDADYRTWLKAAHEPLRSASVLARDGGICRGEMLALQKDCVHLQNRPDALGLWGRVEIRRGLKREARQRDIPVTREMAEVLRQLMTDSHCDYVFTALRDRTQPLSADTLREQHRSVMKSTKLNPDAGLHALRHTFLTEAGRHTKNVRALQKLAGHARIETTMHYIHPDAEDVLEIAGAVQQARLKREKSSRSRVPTKVPTVTRQLNYVAVSNR